MRKLDRSANLENWPSLYYPDLYLLDGGYREFFIKFPDFCEPRDYVSMFDRRFISDCKLHSNLLKKSSSFYPAEDPMTLPEHYSPLQEHSRPLHERYGPPAFMNIPAVPEETVNPERRLKPKSSKRNNLDSPYKILAQKSREKLKSSGKILFNEIENFQLEKNENIMTEGEKSARGLELSSSESEMDFIWNPLLLPSSQREENPKRKRSFLCMSQSSLRNG